MIGFGSLAEKTAAALEKAKRDLARIEADAASHEQARPDGSDLDALVDWKRRKADLAIQREAGEEVLAAAKAGAERQAIAAAEAEKDRRHAAAQKVATAHAKLTLDIVAASEKLAGMLAEAERMRKEIDAANAAREGRPPIVDGEQKVREIPARVIPASIREEIMWVNAAGENPSQLRANNEGKIVPADHRGPWEYKKVQIVQTAERHEYARMPERLTAAVKLVGLKGERLWG